MNLYDLTEGVIEPVADGYHNEKDDKTPLKLSDLRKTRLTLAQLNKLRVLNDVRQLEQEQKMKTLSKQYKAPPADGGGGM